MKSRHLLILIVLRNRRAISKKYLHLKWSVTFGLFALVWSEIQMLSLSKTYARLTNAFSI
ncbi:hypothetical protein X961_5285 [Burkholderia pseudomallei MSHR5613]|nr:hypothetical protein X961_5285 [Burkholderia pseudomallei MSHR5613]